MNFCKTKLAVAVSLAITSLPAFSAPAAGAVDINSTVTARAFATELVPLSTGTTGTVLNNTATTVQTACELSVVNDLGIDLAPADKTYLRFDLSSGAKFSAFSAGNGLSNYNSAAGGATLGAGAGSLVASAVAPTLVSGGAGATFVIYLLENKTSNDTLPKTASYELDISAIEVFDSSNPVQLSYTVHSNDISAAAGTSGGSVQHNVLGVNYLNYGSGFNFRFNEKDLQASVEANFLEFSNADKTKGHVGSMTLAANANICAKNGAFVGAADLIGTTSSKLELTGDFELLQDVDASGVGLGTFNGTASSTLKKGKVMFSSSSCADVTTGANLGTGLGTSGGTKVEFSPVDFSNLFNGQFLCFVRPDGSQVPIVNTEPYTLTLVPESGKPITTTTQVTGKVTRDGVTLEAPFFTLTPGYISRFMLTHLNPSAPDAVFTIELSTDAGNTITPNTSSAYPYDAAKETFTGTLKAGTLLQINASELVTSFSGKQRGSAVFNFSAANSDVQGIYQVVNLTTGEVSNIVMPRPGGGTGTID